jgi:branched-chain amino acid transport system ATP-binding protein
MLDVRGLTIRYGPILAVEDVSLKVEPGQVVALLGANGAGKSSTLKAIAGVLKPAGGEIWWCGDRIDGATPQRVVRKGVYLAPEDRGLFPELSVLENLHLGAYARRDKAAVARDLEVVYDYFPALRQRTRQQAGTLSGGEQQMLVIGRALMARPKLLLLDEPSLGLGHKVVERIFEIIRSISIEQNLSMLLVEQNAVGALRIASHANVLETARLVLSGSADSLRNDPSVQESYLGV